MNRSIADALVATVDVIQVTLLQLTAARQRDISRRHGGSQLPSLQAARSEGMAVRAYISMCFGCPFEGEVDPAVVQVESPHSNMDCSASS